MTNDCKAGSSFSNLFTMRPAFRPLPWFRLMSTAKRPRSHSEANAHVEIEYVIHTEAGNELDDGYLGFGNHLDVIRDVRFTEDLRQIIKYLSFFVILHST
jgi:hypothetical protein